ncbi:MAG: tyrosine--tRNA ligase [Thermoplasmata archaeon]
MDLEARTARVARHTLEVLTPDELTSLFQRTQRPRAYIGFEPSGRLTIAHLITVRKMIDLTEAGCELTVFLADWHAWINDKLGGDLDRIAASGRYMEAAFTALGLDSEKVRFRWSHELTGQSEYWARVLRVARATSVARTKRAMTILGRGEDESQLDTAKLFYPAMQAADIFELPVEIAYGGMDQRRAHVLAREAAQHYGWPTPIAIHTPLLSSLRGGGRMDPSGSVERKMSKSEPSAAIPIPSTEAEVTERIGAAFCPAKEVDANPVVEIVRFIIFPWEERLVVSRAPRHGGLVTFEREADFLEAWRAGTLHPQDLKTAVVESLNRLLAPAQRRLAAQPETAGMPF